MTPQMGSSLNQPIFRRLTINGQDAGEVEFEVVNGEIYVHLRERTYIFDPLVGHDVELNIESTVITAERPEKVDWPVEGF